MHRSHHSSVAALWLWYRGDRFRGFQIQSQGPTVQGALGEALASLGISKTPSPAGRTDLGVHARMQVVSFRTASLDADALKEKLDPLLPSDLGVCALKQAPRSFHAQWKSIGKEYRYRVNLGSAALPYAWRPSEEPRLENRSVDPDRFAHFVARCSGTRDFIAFHEKSSAQRLRTLSVSALVERGSGLYEVRMRGNGFGRYQVRYLVGSALATAAGLIPEADFLAALESGQSIPGIKAPATGLTLWEVLYPPDMDPFSAEERARAPGLPAEPPFV